MSELKPIRGVRWPRGAFNAVQLPGDRVLRKATLADQRTAQFVDQELVRTAWVAGPGCDNPSTFPQAIDNDEGSSSRWFSAKPQNGTPKPIFTADFGSVVTFRKVRLLTVSAFSGTWADQFRAEQSNDGTSWTLIGLFSQVLTTGSTSDNTFDFGLRSMRYLRLTVTIPNAANPTFDWAITEIDAINRVEQIGTAPKLPSDAAGWLLVEEDGGALVLVPYYIKGGSGGSGVLPHTHPISDITGLQAALDGKSAVGHQHTYLQPISDGDLLDPELVFDDTGDIVMIEATTT